MDNALTICLLLAFTGSLAAQDALAITDDGDGTSTVVIADDLTVGAGLTIGAGGATATAISNDGTDFAAVGADGVVPTKQAVAQFVSPTYIEAQSDNGQTVRTSKNPFIYEDVLRDPKSIYDVTSGVLTVPHDGIMTISASFHHVDGTAGRVPQIYLERDQGAGFQNVASNRVFSASTSGSYVRGVWITQIIWVTKGERFRISARNSVNAATQANGVFNRLTAEIRR